MTESDRKFLRGSGQRVGVDVAVSPPQLVRDSTPTPWGKVSYLTWGDSPVRIVAAHGGGQNAHTWDAVAIALARPLVAIDLPGHGQSDWRPDRNYLPAANAQTLARVMDELELQAVTYVGMSLGGLSGIALASQRPDLVRRLILVDVTPGARSNFDNLRDSQLGASTLVGGRRVFASREEMVDASVAALPARSRESLEIGVHHNSRQNPDGTWTWRYDSLVGHSASQYFKLWDSLADFPGDVMLVRGGDSAFVSEEDVATLVSVRPDVRMAVIQGAGHSVQGDKPRELADVVAGFVEELDD